MAEYIEREAVVKRLEEAREWCKNRLSEGEFKSGCIAALGDEIFNIQTRKLIPTADAVEVVRCKDCEHSTLIFGTYVCNNIESPWYNDEFDIDVGANDFCSFGVRKEGG